MAAKDPVLEELMRSARATSPSRSNGALAPKLEANSTLSLDGVNHEDIDAIVNKKWHLEELLGPIRSRLIFLSGGRDKRSAPIITIQPRDHSDVSPINVGKILAYLSKIPNPSLQGLGYTIILDSRQTSWTITKNTLKALQLTFVEHIHQVLVLKPKSFWKRQRVGMGLTLKKTKYSFSTYVLETPSDLLQFLHASQITHDLEGTLVYNHDHWVAVQRSLEKHVLSLQGRVEDFEQIREQLEEMEDPRTLNDARDSVRRHVETKQQLEKADLDIACEAVSHTVSKLLPCENPDFLSCFTYMEDLCSSLQDTRNRLERTWEKKGAQLDRILQIRIYESESEKLRNWIRYEVGSLAQDHTDIGNSPSEAQLRRTAFEDHSTGLKAKYQDMFRTVSMGEKLIAAQHYASEQIRSISKQLEEEWERLRGIIEGRVELLDLSVSFHENQQKFFQKVEVWLDVCQAKDYPPDIPKAQEMLTQHEQLKEACNGLATLVRSHSIKLLEKLRIPVGDSSLPTGFVMGTRHIKEILENLYDEKNWIDEQWVQRKIILHQALNLRKFQEEAKKVHTWFTNTGNPFLSASNSIGRSGMDSSNLLNRHASFEESAEDNYTHARNLQSRAKTLASTKDCDPAMIEEEAKSLTSAFDKFISRMSQRRKIIECAVEFFTKMDELQKSLEILCTSTPKSKFDGDSSAIDPLLLELQTQRLRAEKLASHVHQQGMDLLEMMHQASQSARESRTVVDYSSAEDMVKVKLEGMKSQEKMWSICKQRETRWNLTLRLNQFEPDVEKHILQFESWIQEQENTEWELAQNEMDARLQLDAFQRQYDQMNKSHLDLVEKGRGTASEIDQLDLTMFGGKETNGSTHPAVVKVEGVVAKMAHVWKAMEGVAGPLLQRLKDCHICHFIKQSTADLTTSLISLSASLLHISEVGETLDKAQTLHQKATEAQQTFEDLKRDVKETNQEVAKCVARGHSDAGVLKKLAEVLKERCIAVERLVRERVKVVTATLDFHQNLKNWNTSMDECEVEFSSKEFGKSIVEAKKLQKSVTEKRAFIKQATEVIHSQGKKLQEILNDSRTMLPNRRGSTFDLSRTGEEESNHTSFDIRRVRSSENFLDTIDEPTSPNELRSFSNGEATDSDSDTNLRGNHTPSSSIATRGVKLHNSLRDRSNSWDILDSKEVPLPVPSPTFPTKPRSSSITDSDSPRVLVHPKRTRGGLKAASSISALPVNQDQQVIKQFLGQIDRRLKQLVLLCERRKTGLEEAQKAMEFIEVVPEILEWIDTVGAKFLQDFDHYGRSIEEVKQLLAGCAKFEKSEFVEMSEKVRKLFVSYRSLKGQPSVPEVRTHYTTLQTRWEAFDGKVRKVTANMELSLKFHQVLYESSSWCMECQNYFNEMDMKAEEIKQSDVASSLKEALSLFYTPSIDQQEGRIEQLKHISTFLNSSNLTNLTNQMIQSTKQMESEFEFCKVNLEHLYDKYHNQEDKAVRDIKLTKKRVLVMEELLLTEEAYVKDLRLIVERFRPRFISDILPNTLKGKEKIIFGNIHEIENFHRTFLFPRLQDHNGIVDHIADLFVECVDEMVKIYVPFCLGKMASEELLASHRTYLARLHGLFNIETPLSTLMIKPIQRITKYPLLFKDALKLTSQLGQSTKSLEKAVNAVEKVLLATNNAIHTSFLENSEELISELGEVQYQGSLVVSEQSRFGIKAEKERRVFCFKHTLLLARKVELQIDNTQFKYEVKDRIPISSRNQIIEFVEGEPTRFLLVTGDQKLHLKAPVLEEKQEWVKILRSAIFSMSSHASPNKMGERSKSLDTEIMTKYLQPSPTHSPNPARKEQMKNGKIPHGSPVLKKGYTIEPQNEKELDSSEEFVKYEVKENYHSSLPPDSLTLSLKQGDIVEVLDNSIDGKWFVRAQSGKEGVTHGWFPSSLLERVNRGEEDVDGKKGWVQITAGPLSGTSDEEKIHRLEKNKKAFGSHDIHSLQVISNLKKVTIALEGGRQDNKDEEEEKKVREREGRTLQNGVESSLDFTSLDAQPSPARSPRQQRSHTEASISYGLGPPGTPTNPERRTPSPSSPFASPHHQRIRRHTDAEVTSPTSSTTRPNRVSQFTRKKNVKGRSTRKGPKRSSSVSSDHSEGGHSIEGEESPSEKITSSGSEDTLNLKASASSPEGQSVSDSSSTSLSPEKKKKAQVKIKHILKEVIDTEATYVAKLEECITSYMSEMDSPNLPNALKGKKKTIFGNIKSLLYFHRDTFLEALKRSQDSLEATVQCFVDHAHNFDLYVTYCENKPKSESFLWTYTHSGGTFFEDIQQTLKNREGIDSFLIRPVQRMSMYKLLLRDLRATAEKISMVTPALEKAVQITQEVPKRANDAMTLSMIYGCEGNVHKFGQLILQDEFTVSEKGKRSGTRRQLFLLDQRLIITKEKDADGLFVFKDSLKVHSLLVAEKEGDHPNRFAVGTGVVGDWDQYYLLEASSVEKKQEWLQALKDIMKRQFELLKALASSGTRVRNEGLASPSLQPRTPTLNHNTVAMSVAMINVSDDSEQEDEEMEFPLTPSGARPRTNTTAFSLSPTHFPDVFGRSRANTVSVGEATPASPTFAPRTLNLYIVAEDCAPPKDDEGIMYILKGQIFDVMDSSSDWWLARLVRDITPKSLKFYEQGWVPGSFLDRFDGHLGREEEAAIQAEYQRRNLKSSGSSPGSSALKLASLAPGNSSTVPLPHERKKKLKKKKSNPKQEKLRVTSSYSFQEIEENEKQMKDGVMAVDGNVKPKAPEVMAPLCDETIISGRSVYFRCGFDGSTYPLPSVEWSCNGALLTIDRAFASVGKDSCVLRINDVDVMDEGDYTCTIANEEGVASSTARLTVLSSPDPPYDIVVRPLTSTSVRLSWTPPIFTGHSPISHYLVEYKDTIYDKWNSVMKHITEPHVLVEDLVPGTEYTFGVYAINPMGSSPMSEESEGVKLSKSHMEVTEFSLEPFDTHYELQGKIGRGRFGVVHKCLHKKTHQTFAAKLLPLDVGRDHAQHELEILCGLDHPNIVQLTSAHLTQKNFILIFQRVSGLNILEYFVKYDNLTEQCAALCMQQVFHAVNYLHQQMIAHLGIRPQNVLVYYAVDEDLPLVKLIHFERSRKLDSSTDFILERPHGDIAYEAPEILQGQPATTAADMWSSGVLLYALLGGTSPFQVDSLDLTRDNIIASHFSFPVRSFKDISASATSFISALLVKDGSKRLDCQQALKQSWLKLVNEEDESNTTTTVATKLSTARLKTYVTNQKWTNNLHSNSP